MVSSFSFYSLIQLSHPLSSLQLAGEGGDDGEIEDEEDDEDGDGDGELQAAGKRRGDICNTHYLIPFMSLIGAIPLFLPFPYCIFLRLINRGMSFPPIIDLSQVTSFLVNPNVVRTSISSP